MAVFKNFDGRGFSDLSVPLGIRPHGDSHEYVGPLNHLLYKDLGIFGPGQPVKHAFEIINTSDESFIVTHVVAPCHCNVEGNLVGLRIPACGTLVVPCVLVVSSESTDTVVRVVIETNASSPHFRNISLVMAARAKFRYRAEPRELSLDARSASNFGLVHISGDKQDLPPPIQEVFSTRDFVSIDIIDDPNDYMVYRVQVDSTRLPNGLSDDFVSFIFPDVTGVPTRVDVRVRIRNVLPERGNHFDTVKN